MKRHTYTLIFVVFALPMLAQNPTTGLPPFGSFHSAGFDTANSSEPQRQFFNPDCLGTRPWHKFQFLNRLRFICEARDLIVRVSLSLEHAGVGVIGLHEAAHHSHSPG